MPTVPQGLRRQADDEAPAPTPVSGSGQPQPGAAAGSEGTAAGSPPYYGQDPWAPRPMGGPTAQEFVPAGAWPPAQSEPFDPDDTGSWTWSSGRGWHGGNDWRRGSDGHVGSDRDDKPPTWDGSSVPLLTYLRKIEIWEAYTKTDPSRRAIKLLSCLEGDAFEKLELISPADLKRPDGVEVFIDILKRYFEPLEHRRVGKIMDDFIYKLERGSEETVHDFNTRFDRETSKAEKVAGVLTPIWKAHLYLKKLKLRDDREALILASSMGQYTYEALSKAAVITFPTAASVRSGSRFEAPRREQYHTKGGSRGKTRPWKKTFGKGHRVNEVHEDDEGTSQAMVKNRKTLSTRNKKDQKIMTSMTPSGRRN